MLASYDAQDAWGLRVNSQHSLTPRCVLTHKEKIEIHRTFIYEPLQALNAKKKPMEFLSFQPRENQNFKGWSTSANDMRQKQNQESNVKPDILSVSILHFDRTLGTSIATPSDRKLKCSINSNPAGP